MNDAPLFFIIAGEASGDFLGAALMRSLKKKTSGNARFAGIGGERMSAEGLDTLFSQSELAHVGFFEIVKHVPQLLKRINQTVGDIIRLNPAAVITIDSPDFCFRVAKKLKKKNRNIPVIHYVAPTVWAWRPGRARKIAKFLDHLMALLPFEPPYFTCENLPSTFVGHPIVESRAGHGNASRFVAKYSIPMDATLLALLPGSRVSEVKRLLPVFGATAVWLRAKWPGLFIVIPAANNVVGIVQEAVKSWPIPVVVTVADEDKYDAFAAASVALACSGTVSIELAMAGLPSVIAYKINQFTFMLYKRLIKAKFVTLVNIMHNRAVMPEFLQKDCSPEKLANAINELLENHDARSAQLTDLKSMAGWLGRGQFIPSDKAAQTILDTVYMRQGK